jgi:chaperonin GroEL (HSP60 family)
MFKGKGEWEMVVSHDGSFMTRKVTVTKNRVTVAKEVVNKTSHTAGNEATMATILAVAIYSMGQKLMSAGVSPRALSRGIDKGVEAVSAK